MGVEIERKFLVKDLPSLDGHVGHRTLQGYISTQPDCVIRVRIKNDKGFITLKGMPVGISRSEFEYEIPMLEAETMLLTFCKSRIEKHRFFIPFQGYIWEVDIFHGENEGLIVAEIELPSQDAVFDIPEWIGKEVSHLPRYLNACLSERPYKQWEEAEQKALDA